MVRRGSGVQVPAPAPPETLFTADLAFSTPCEAETAKLSVLAVSVLASLIGAVILHSANGGRRANPRL
jgi:Na+/H+ antiporter NhaA